MIMRTTSDIRGGNMHPPTGPWAACQILFRHKGKMLVVFCATIAIVLVGLAVFPKSYTSDARLFVRLGKESVSLDPTATLNQTVSLSESRESEINSELEILKSRVLLEDVVDRLGAEKLQNLGNDGNWMNVVMVPVTALGNWLSPEVGAKESAVNWLSKRVAVASPRHSNIIVVKCTAPEPKLAQSILQAFMDSYMERHLHANRTSGSHDFFVDQSNLIQKQLEAATRELRDCKNRTRLVTIAGQQDSVQNEVNSIESAMLQNQRALASADATVRALKQSLAELPLQLTAEEAEAPNVAADFMRNELYKVQILEKEASSRYTSEHPKVIALRRQVAETEKIFDAQIPHRSHATRKLSVVHQSVQTELMSAQALAESHRAEGELLAQQHEAVQLKVRNLNDNEFHIAELTRQAESLEDSYRHYVSSREQARIDQALAAGRISNVNVVQPASLITKASSPSVRIWLLLGFIVATAGAVWTAFLAEWLDRTLKTAEQVELELGVPVLFSVPRVTRDVLVKS